MRISSFEWDESNIGHIAMHNITPEEVEDACDNMPFILKGKGGVYLIYSQSNAGRFILTIAKYRGRGIIRVITARDMTEKERKLCKERR